MKVHKIVRVHNKRLYSTCFNSLGQYRVEYIPGQWTEPILVGSLLFCYPRDQDPPREDGPGWIDELWLAEAEGVEPIRARAFLKPDLIERFWFVEPDIRVESLSTIECDYIGAKRLKLLERIS